MEADVEAHSSDSVATRELNDENERECTPEIGMDRVENLLNSENEDEDCDPDDCINITFGSKIEELQSSLQSGAPAVKVNASGLAPSKPIPIPKLIKTTQDPSIEGTSIYDYNIDTSDKPWLKPGADISDYFNYGFNEDTWKSYCERQRILRSALGHSGHAMGALAQLLPVNQGGRNQTDIVESISKVIPGVPQQIVEKLHKQRHCTLTNDHFKMATEKLRLSSEVSKAFILMSIGGVSLPPGVKVNAGSFTTPHNCVDGKTLQWDLKELCKKLNYSKTLYKEIDSNLSEVCKDSQFVIVEESKKPLEIEKSKSHRSHRKSDYETDHYRRKRSRDRSSSDYDRHKRRSRRDSSYDRRSTRKRSRTPERSREDRNKRRRRRRSTSSRS